MVIRTGELGREMFFIKAGAVQVQMLLKLAASMHVAMTEQVEMQWLALYQT